MDITTPKSKKKRVAKPFPILQKFSSNDLPMYATCQLPLSIYKVSHILYAIITRADTKPPDMDKASGNCDELALKTRVIVENEVYPMLFFQIKHNKINTATSVALL